MSNVISMGRGAMIEPVHSIESEQQLIGALFLRPELVERLHGVLVEEDFHEPLHSAIYGALVGLSDAGEAISIGLVSDALGEVQLPQGQTVRRYLADMMAACASTDVRAHAKVIKRAAHIRAAVEAGTWLTEGLSRASIAQDPTDVVQAAIDRLDGIVSDRQSAHLRSVTVDNALRDAIDHAQAVRNGEIAPGVSYGLSTLDYYTHGMHPGQLVVLAGRPGMGKTAVALHFAMMAATKSAGVAYFSLEMGPQELAQRVLAGMCYRETAKPVTYRDIREAKNLTPGDIEKLDSAQRDLQGLPLIIEPQPAVTITQIAARARRMAKSMASQGGALKVIIVDHIGLVRPSQRYSGSRVNEVSEITAALKSLARELDCTVLALSQLNRATESRPIADRRPTLSDLRDSGSIEQDADTVMSLFREEYYLERKPDQTDDDMLRLEQVRNTIEIEILKQRQGQTKRMTFFCDIGFNVIAEMAR